jgi:nicotinamide phosphoribosyltransferase
MLDRRLFNLLRTDSYKVSHYRQYPPKTQGIFSYLESRGGAFPSTVFFGLQYILKEYLQGQYVTAKNMAFAKRFADKHLGSGLFNEKGWNHILQAHQGRLPLVIKAVPEGTLVPVHNALITIENTDDEVPWLTNYVETLLVQSWYPITVATQSYYIKKRILAYLEETGDVGLIDFKLHDFGFRGVSSTESAGIGGLAHLVNFKGTDTMEALYYAYNFYEEECAGFSIPAAEHSTITSWGQEHEVDAFKNMLEQFPTGLVAVVSDSFDIYNACRNLWGHELKKMVLERDGVLVIRPDSGSPEKVVCDVLDILGEAFGYTVNAKGYKVLNPKVRVIQGDGVDYESIHAILQAMKIKRWSADNVAFGMGGALLQKLNRDTQRFAFKASAALVNGVHRDVFKDPRTDPGKVSKKGYLQLSKVDDIFVTETATAARGVDAMHVVFKNGELLNTQTLAEIRNRINETLI